MAGFEGKWKVESTENFDEYLKAIGVGMMVRKMAGSSKPPITITRSGDRWTIKTEGTKTTEISFVFGQEFDETTADGRKVKSTVVENNPRRWTQEQKGEIPSTIIREVLDENTLKFTSTAKGVTTTRIYKRG